MATGLSPILGPTYTSSSSSNAMGGVSTLSGSMLSGGGAFDYSTFGQFHISPPDSQSHLPSLSHHDNATILLGGVRRQSRSGSLHSFSNVSNVDHLRSMSPQDLPPPLHSRSSPASSRYPTINALSTDDKARLKNELKVEEPPAEEDPRIRAYAKLEFPSLDIYIQKLSIIVGRRPAGANVGSQMNLSSVPVSNAAISSTPFAAPAPALPSVEQSVKLEDFVIGMDEEVKKEEDQKGVENLAVVVEEAYIKQEPGEVLAPEMVPQLSITPSSPQAGSDRPNNADESFSEFVKSTSPPPPTSSGFPTAQETSDLLDLLAEATADASSSQPSTSVSAAQAQLATESPLPTPTPIPSTPQALPLAPSSTVTDIDLGPIRAVSRQHARLYFDYEMGGWAIEVLGRNGVVVEGKWKAKGEKEGLGKRFGDFSFPFCVHASFWES